MRTRPLYTSGAGRVAVWATICAVPLVSAAILSNKIIEPPENNACHPVPSLAFRTISYLAKVLKPSSTIHSSLLLACSAQDGQNLRLKQTAADHYYSKHKELPRPSIMHAALPVAKDQPESTSNKIFVIGDVHGCMIELQSLIERAVQDHNDGEPFSCIVLVGDLCNKGPQSAQVVRWARTTENVFTVRGNHDDGALQAALGDSTRRKKKKYQWVMEGEGVAERSTPVDRIVLSDEDVAWLSERPYTLTIPGWYLGQEEDTLIVHAGLIPNKALEDQAISTMITIREVLPICDQRMLSNDVPRFEYHERQKGKAARGATETICDVPIPWALAWKGPQRVIFGHDARRGLQRYEGDYAIGLDTGAVYGKQLTGLILPQRTFVSVPSKVCTTIDKTT